MALTLGDKCWQINDDAYPFGFLVDLSPRGYKSRYFLVPLNRLTVRWVNLYPNLCRTISKVHKPGSFNDKSTHDLGCLNIWAIRLNFAGCETFLHANFRFLIQLILAICQWWVIFLYFERLHSFISMALLVMWILNFVLRETYPWKLWEFLFIFWLNLLYSVPYFLFLCELPSSSFHTVLDAMSS